MRKVILIGTTLLILVAAFLFWKNRGTTAFPVHAYYAYDEKLPLNDSISVVKDDSIHSLLKVFYTSVHNEQVSGLLSIPKGVPQPAPVVILLHGLGDSKTVDYIEAGHAQLLESGLAVFRIDIANHGERKKRDYPFDLTGDYRYWTRDLLTQTVFDLRRAVDWLETRPEIDAGRIGYYGISLGGVIGTIFCSVEERVKVPVIALAGGNLNLMFGKEMISQETMNYLSVIEPRNFVAQISPRPLLMINAEQDEVIPPIMTKLLFQQAREPKHIVWFPTRHRELPVRESYREGIEWFQDYL